MTTSATSATHKAIMAVGGTDHAPMLVADSYVHATDTSPLQPEETKMETYTIVSEDKKKMIDAEAKAVHIILTRIDNDIYSIVDAYGNAKEMWIAIKRLMQGENINKHDMETNLF
ncbi:hypothetical protein Tco_0847684 [Tanacetum coccineum]